MLILFFIQYFKISIKLSQPGVEDISVLIEATSVARFGSTIFTLLRLLSLRTLCLEDAMCLFITFTEVFTYSSVDVRLKVKPVLAFDIFAHY